MKTIENDRLLIEVNEKGCELTRIFDKKKQREMMWCGDPAVWGSHSPLLFPMVGRSYKGVYRHAGRTYEITNHGFGRRADFTFCDTCNDMIVGAFSDTEETRAVYPFKFETEVSYKIVENEIIVSWKVKNTGTETMYYNIGGHPGFATQPGVKTSDMYLRFPGKTSVDYFLAHKESLCAVSDTVYRMPLNPDGSVRITPTFFDNDAYIFGDQSVEEVEILDENKAPYVKVKCAGFPYLGIWSKPGSSFICLEPWHGICDEHGYTGELKDKNGIKTLEPGCVDKYSYSIFIM